jgi:hypothetical protein
MSKSSRKFSVIILAAGFGIALCKARTGVPVAADSNAVQRGETAKRSKNVEIVLTGDKIKASLQDYLTLSISILNDGPDAVYVYRHLAWGYSGGLVLHVQNEKGEPVGQLECTVPPPPPPDDPTILVLLEEGRFYGVRRRIRVDNFMPSPGRYTLRVEYWSPIPRAFVDPKLRNLTVLWHEDPSLYSNKLDLEVVP